MTYTEQQLISDCMSLLNKLYDALTSAGFRRHEVRLLMVRALALDLGRALAGGCEKLDLMACNQILNDLLAVLDKYEPAITTAKEPVNGEKQPSANVG